MLLIHNALLYSALGNFINYQYVKSLRKAYKQAKICGKLIKYDTVYSNLIGGILIKKISKNYRTLLGEFGSFLKLWILFSGLVID